MDQGLPTIQNHKQWIKALKAQRDALDKQIRAYEDALAAQTGMTMLGKPKKRKRQKTADTLELEEKVKEVYRTHGQESLQLIDVMRETIGLYQADKQIAEEEMRGRFNNLKKSGFLVRSDKYGFYKLGSPSA